MKIFNNIVQQNNQIQTQNLNSNRVSQFGLKLQQPLMKDTVSFGQAKTREKAIKIMRQEVKAKFASSFKNERSQAWAIKMSEYYQEAHKNILKDIKKCFGDSMYVASNMKEAFKPSEKKSITLTHRIKTVKSLREKSSYTSKIEDPSGFCFIIENQHAMKEFINGLENFLKDGNSIVDYEYHKLTPRIEKISRKQTIIHNFDIFEPKDVSKLNEVITKTGFDIGFQNGEVLNERGYSAIHITIKDSKDVLHEFQIKPRREYNVGEAQHLCHKASQGKDLPKEFQLINLSDLNPNSSMSENDRNAVAEYNLNAFIDAIEHPYSTAEFPKPKNPRIAKFDLNTIFALMKSCLGM